MVRIYPPTAAIVLIIVLLQVGCLSTTTQFDFCATSKVGDVFRVPLRVPYELRSADSYSWSMEWNHAMKNNIIGLSNIQAVGVTDSLILLNLGRHHFQSRMTEVWFLLDMSNKSDLAFTDKTLVEDYFSSNGQKMPTVHAPQALFSKYKMGGKLPWVCHEE